MHYMESTVSPPRSVLAWVPYFWSHVLFPGSRPSLSPPRRGALLLLLIMPALLLYPCLSFHLFEPDEGRYAEIPREMLTRGEWVVPILQGQPYLDKPPLLYWLVMASYKIFGVHDWSARLVPALALHACIVLTYLLGRKLLGERAAFWGALLLAVAPGFVSVGRLLVLDGLLALWVWLSVLAAFAALQAERLRWSWWLLAAAACGLGVLTKGPIAVVLLVPPLWGYRRLGGRQAAVDWRALTAFTGVVLVVNVPWYVGVCLRAPEFAGYFFWKHNVLRFLTPFDHLEPVWYYAPLLLAGLLPATLLAWPFVRYLGSGDRQVAETRCPELGFLLLTGGWCVLFFSLSGSKLPTYILPAFPPLALATGTFVAYGRGAGFRGPAVAVGCTALVLVVAHYGAVPWYARHRSPMSHEHMVRQHCESSAVPVVCYPRACDSVSFYLRRDDLKQYRSKDTRAMLDFLQQQPRAVLLCTHRHSIRTLREILPQNNLRIAFEAPLYGSAQLGPEGDCHMAVVESLDAHGLQATGDGVGRLTSPSHLVGSPGSQTTAPATP